MVMKKGKAQMLALMLIFMACSIVNGATLAEQCANEFTQETVCLIFVTGKADKPTKECCSTLIDIRDKDPVCLCYIMQQILNGTNPQLKSMGIQGPRLYQLPSACKSSDASITDCPKLMHLPANSPASAIFTNPSASATTTPGSSSSPTTKAGLNGFKHVGRLAGPIGLAMAIFFCALP